MRRDKEDLGKSQHVINLADSMADYQSRIRQLE